MIVMNINKIEHIIIYYIFKMATIKYVNVFNCLKDWYVIKSLDVTIETMIIPFEITTNKCRSYLDLHYVDLELTNEILNRCCLIFNILFKYIVGDEIIFNSTVVCKTFDFWENLNDNFNSMTPKNKFNSIFYNSILRIQCNDPRSEMKIIYQINEILTNDECFKNFNDHYIKSYGYNEIYDTIKQQFYIITGEYLQEEIIDNIICYACKYYILNQQ